MNCLNSRRHIVESSVAHAQDARRGCRNIGGVRGQQDRDAGLAVEL